MSAQTEREREAALLVIHAMTLIDKIENATPVSMAGEENSPRRLRQYRKMHMGDAKRISANAMLALRQAWEILNCPYLENKNDQ